MLQRALGWSSGCSSPQGAVDFKELWSPGCTDSQGSQSLGCSGPQGTLVPKVQQPLEYFIPYWRRMQRQGVLLAPALCWIPAFSTLVSILVPRAFHKDSLSAGSPLIKDPLASCHTALLLTVAQVPCSLGGPGLLLPPISAQGMPACWIACNCGVTCRSGHWPARTRHGGCCGCWRRRHCSQVATRTLCWNGFSPTMAPRKVARKVRVGLVPWGCVLVKYRSCAHQRCVSLQGTTRCSPVTSPDTSSWVTAQGPTGSSTMPQAGSIMSSTTQPPKTPLSCCRNHRSE